MVRRAKRTVVLYIASIVVAWPQPGSAHAQEKPESSLSALFPVAGHAAVDLGGSQEVRADPATFSGDPRLGRQPVDDDADGGKVFATTALGTAAGYLGFMYTWGRTWDTKAGDGAAALLGTLGVLSIVGLPAVGADMGGGDGSWALLGSAIGLVGGWFIGLNVVDEAVGEASGVAGTVVFFGTHVTVTTLFALK